MMKHISFAAAATVVAILAGAPAARATTTGHLYVHPRGGALERFTLNDGLPARQPDLKYPFIDGLVTTAGDGTLFGMHGSTIFAFPLGTNKPSRHITIPQLKSCGLSSPLVNAIGADVNEYLYVTLSNYISGTKHQPQFAQPMREGRFACNGYNVFGPRQHDFAKPLYAHEIGGEFLQSVAVDRHENMYILNDAAYAIQRYTTPLVQPTLTGTFNLGIEQYQVAVDASNNAVMLYNGATDDRMHVAVFPPGSNGQGPPSNDFVPISQIQQLIAVREPYVFVCDSEAPLVDVYNEFANGMQSPLALLPIGVGCDQITAGP